MSFFSRLFGSRSSAKGVGDLDKRLKKLEAEADTATPGYVGSSYNRAGDLALREGHPARAVEYYGRAIDAFLEDGQREAARGVANKIIRVRPTAVRTLCTLTWLDLAMRHSATALLHLRDYVEAAKNVNRASLAASQIYEMARLVPESEFIGAVADALDGLDFSGRAEEVRGWSAGGSPEAITDPVELSHACLEAAVRSNQGNLVARPAEAPAQSAEESGTTNGEAAPDGESGSDDVPESDDDALATEGRSPDEATPDAATSPPDQAEPTAAGEPRDDDQADPEAASDDESASNAKGGRRRRKHRRG
jgi:tetratricopeptide (TPR) repeat protein